MSLSPSILIVEDHEVVSWSIKMIVKENFSQATVQYANTFALASEMTGSGHNYDLLVLDIDIPGGMGEQMIGKLKACQPGMRILIFSGKDEADYAVRFLSAGADGYLSKGAPLEELGSAIRMVLANRKYMSAKVQQQVFHNYFSPASSKVNEQALSEREQQVLDLLLQGKLSKDIARLLNLQVSTVGTHKIRILRKMGVSNMLELFKKVSSDSKSF